MKRHTRNVISVRAYERAQKHAHRPWAQALIAQFAQQTQAEQRLGKYQKDNTRDWTPAERAFADILRESSVYYVREHGFQCKDGRTYFVDFFIKSPRLAFEIDGGIHKRQENYDTQRDVALMTDYAMPIHRFTNDEVLNEPERVRLFVLRAVTEAKEQRATARRELKARQDANRARRERAAEYRRVRAAI